MNNKSHKKGGIIGRWSSRLHTLYNSHQAASRQNTESIISQYSIRIESFAYKQINTKTVQL